MPGASHPWRWPRSPGRGCEQHTHTAGGPGQRGSAMGGGGGRFQPRSHPHSGTDPRPLPLSSRCLWTRSRLRNGWGLGGGCVWPPHPRALGQGHLWVGERSRSQWGAPTPAWAVVPGRTPRPCSLGGAEAGPCLPCLVSLRVHLVQGARGLPGSARRGQGLACGDNPASALAKERGSAPPELSRPRWAASRCQKAAWTWARRRVWGWLLAPLGARR